MAPQGLVLEKKRKIKKKGEGWHLCSESKKRESTKYLNCVWHVRVSVYLFAYKILFKRSLLLVLRLLIFSSEATL